jgi:predicted dehydrogenase
MAVLRWGLIGGGEGSQIGPAHRMAARLDGLFRFCGGALDVEPNKGISFARSLGADDDRCYGDWREMLDRERDRPDKLDLVTVATPNATHYEIANAFLAAGFNVLCEKPMTMKLQEAREIVRLVETSGLVFAVNYGYSGYPLVRHMRAMVGRGGLGGVRLIKAEFAHGFHADAADRDNPRLRWRYDRNLAGASAVFADAGIHAFHMACFVSGQSAIDVSADFASIVSGRELEDDAMLNFRMDGGAIVRLWTSAIAIGRMHGLTLQVFGEKGGLRWVQEQPNQLYWTPLNGRTEIIERGTPGLSPEADRASRVTVGHAEGMPLAFANIYRDLADAIVARQSGIRIDPFTCSYPTARDGFRSIAAIEAAVRSAASKGAPFPIDPN